MTRISPDNRAFPARTAAEDPAFEELKAFLTARSSCRSWRATSEPRYDLLFFLGIFAPDFLASLSAIATACFRLFTFFRPPDFRVPSLYSCITFLVFERPFDWEGDFFFEAVFLAIIPIC